MTQKSQKSQKVARKFECKICDYVTCRKNDFEKHLSTAKHQMMTNGDRNDDIKSHIMTAYLCDCGRSYAYRQSFHRHKNSCEKVASIIESKNEIIQTTNKDHQLILDLLAQNKELISILHETVPKIGNNNTTTNNNQFNLQVFLNEDCKDAINFSDFIKQIQVSFEDLENQVESGYVKGISKLFIESLQGLGTNKRPIHCTDKKRKTLYIKENDAWDKEGSQDMLIKGINEVTRRTMQTLMKEKENQSEEYADMDSEFSMKCLDIQRNLFPSAPRETTINKVVENITKNSGIIE